MGEIAIKQITNKKKVTFKYTYYVGSKEEGKSPIILL